jgi:hypothetical protein
MVSMTLAVHRRVVCQRPLPGYERWARFIHRLPWEWMQRALQWSIPRYTVWEDESDNLVTTAGKNKTLDAAFKTGLTTPAWYVGLVNDASWSAYAAGDILSSHGGWLETTLYSGTRKAWTAGTIASGSVDNSASNAVFAINNTVTVRGCFLCDATSGTTGTLLGEGDFASSRALVNGDTLSVTITLTV